jgi:NADH-quinone oxidoreductase subunit N
MQNDFFFLMKSELLVTAIIFITLFLKLGLPEENNTESHKKFLNIINLLLLINVVAGFFMNADGYLFGDMFRNTPLMSLEKNILNLGTLVISLQSYDWLRKHQHPHEFYILMLSTLLGMFFMISSENLMMFYLALELSTIPLAAMVNFDLEEKRSSEAALKMIMMSAFSSAILLFGLSLLYGTSGTLNFTDLPVAMHGNPLQIFALVLIISGFGFKISAVPFHFWTADVYEGAPVAVTSYLSVISKGAMLFVMTTVLYKVFQPFEAEWYHIIFILAVATMVVGNLFALRQHNLKRLLAFSSIAQVGFILVGLSGQSVTGSTSVVYFVLIYLFSNLGAFGVISLVSSLTGKENIDDFKGFYKTNPLMSWVLAISLFSLAGIPPTAGFFGKFFLIMAGAGKENYTLIIIASLNMVVSLYYYLRVIKAVFMDKNENALPALTIPAFPKIAMFICLAGIIITGLSGGAFEYINNLMAAL